MLEYQWALGNGEIVSANYNRAIDSLSNEQVLVELKSAFEQFGHSVQCQAVSEQLSEVYTITFDDSSLEKITICAKGTTPGGRSNLNDEQRTQQKSKYINYAYSKLQGGKSAVQLGVYRRDGQTVFCAWKLKQSTAGPDTPISKQIKISTIAQAMKEGFVQQDKGSGEFACAFRKEFIYFYIRNADWIHGSPITELSNHYTEITDGDTLETDYFNYDSLRQEWMDKDNQGFILSCLDFMKAHELFTDYSLKALQSKEQCSVLFHHNSLNGILLRVNPGQPEDEQRNDTNGNARYYSEKYTIAENEYFVSSEWRPDRGDARKPLIDWIFALMQEIKFSTDYQSEFPRNRILFGAPGTGKSFTLNHEKDVLLADGGEYERVTFHPDYSYANFVGTYKPVPCKDSDSKDAITYSYVPGPFMRTYVKALKNSRTDDSKPFLLIIEEINRANVAAVFGDVFQLLDRGDDEVSEYPIQASEDIKKYLADKLGGNPDDYAEIRIPDNMFIWATMNSADQGVFPMDTAFKRRWDFTYLGIDDGEAEIVGKKVILGQGDYRRIVEWNALRKAINNELLTYKVNEDKLMGPYFISKKNLPEGEMFDPAAFTRIFKNKIIMYLFDDAAKQKRITLFGGCDENAKNQYSKICKEFDQKGVCIFCDSISSHFIDKVPEDDGE